MPVLVALLVSVYCYDETMPKPEIRCSETVWSGVQCTDKLKDVNIFARAFGSKQVIDMNIIELCAPGVLPPLTFGQATHLG